MVGLPIDDLSTILSLTLSPEGLSKPIMELFKGNTKKWI